MADESKRPIIIRKKRGGAHAGAHGGAWKVAYADFVTAMMAFFMVLWLMGADEVTKASIQDYFLANDKVQFDATDSLNKNGRALAGDASHREDGDQGRYDDEVIIKPTSTAPVYLEEQAALQDLSDSSDGVAFTKDTDGDNVKFEVPKGVKFEPGSNELPTDSRSYLFRLAETFKAHDGTVVVEGNFDEKPNWPLAFGRAMAVRNFLVDEGGVNPDKIIPSAAFAVQDGRKIASLDANKGFVKFVMKRVRN